ncbi:MAG: polysaccharide biosynthesis tyrosine autokinase [Candidatus Omnitrophota bacterium]|nr:polysaccharide biosynthesis tyrosine autokinase [Candidatus Omnitrophota bacterium]
MPNRPEDWQLDDYLRAMRLHRWTILLFVLGSSLLGFSRVIQKPNIYRASARILIETQAPRVVQFQEIATTSPGDRSFLQTEYQVISSYAVMSKVVEDLNLASFPPFSQAKDPALMLQSMVLVSPVRATKLVDIIVIGTKPDLITRIANGVAETYARTNLERRRDLTTGGAQWLREEVDRMETRMRESQIKLQEFREQHGATDFGDQTQSSVLQRLQALNVTLNKVREDRLDAEMKYREKHPTLLELMAKERELQLALFDQEQKALELSRLSIQYTALLRESKTSEAIYNILLTRLKELSVQEGLQNNNVQRVDEARLPTSPIGPARAKEVAGATFIGLLLGCGVALLREFTTKTVRTRQDFELLLEIPFLGHIPQISVPRKPRQGQKAILLPDLKSQVAETVRSVRTTLEFILPSDQPHILLLTSALPEEGKSTISINLAIALHELGRKVLLIDADLRRPALHRYLDLPLEPGLSGFLQDTVTAQELLQPVPSVEGLQAISAGLTPRQPTDLLSNQKFQEALRTWKNEFQYILIDSPPVLVAADVAVMATFADGVIYIVRANRTHSEAVAAGKQRLVDVGAKVIGGVLNGAHIELERGYRYYYSNKYYRQEPRRGKKPRGTPKLISDPPPASESVGEL